MSNFFSNVSSLIEGRNPDSFSQSLFDWFIDHWIAISIVSVLIIITSFLVTDYVTGVPYTIECIVLEKIYTPSSTSTGVGTGFSSSGSVITMPTTSHQSEAFTLLLKDPNGSVFSERVSAEVYAGKSIGETVTISGRRGGITGW